MAEEQDKEQKTEEPTQRRIEEAVKKGNVVSSREMTSFLMLAVLALTVAWFAPYMLKNAKLLLLPFIANADSLPTGGEGLNRLLSHSILSALLVVAAPLIGCMVVAIASNLMQHGFILTSEPIAPKLERISIITGVQRLFSLRSVVEFVKSILKIIIIGFVAFIAIYPELVHIRRLPIHTVESMLAFLGMLALRMTIGVAIAMFFIAILDFMYQRFQYFKSLRMSRQELKDEYKQLEGDPMVKQRLKMLRQERARKRMMAAVPKADVVITNPTHFSVALQYDTKTMKAPVVVAKGQDLIALKIREVAKENDVPIVENPPLARSLYDSVDLDEEIPVAHYEAVAKVISYVYQLKGKKVA